MRVTFFKDVQARRCKEQELTTEALVTLISSTSAPTKFDLPLLKLATFGELHTSEGSLRHNENVLLIYGVECDYDAERMTYEEAEIRLKTAGVESILYTSPRHTPTTPRWRVLFPFAGHMLPAGREKMAHRANTILGGVLAQETWKLSQAFFYGHATSNEHFRLTHLPGVPLDTLNELSETPYVKPSKQTKRAAHAADGAPIAVEDLPPRVKRTIKAADPAKLGFASRSEAVFFVTCSLVRAGWDDDRIRELLLDKTYPISSHIYDQGNPHHYATKQIQDAQRDVDESWNIGRNGAILPNDQENQIKALRKLGAAFSYDTFVRKGYVNGAGPRRQVDDHELVQLRLGIDREFGFLPNKDLFFDVIDLLQQENKTHPVVEFLEEVEKEWDSKPRIGDEWTPSWLTTFGQAEDTPYTRAVGRLILVAACRRVRQPGCKFDEMVVLVDPTQGTDKSTTLRTLAVKDEWFTDNLPLHADSRMVIEMLQGKWIVEYSELNGIKHNDVETLKAFLSRQVDSARAAYARVNEDVPRQCVFFGTTNSTQFLRDIQNRRYWPVQVKPFNIAALKENVRQMWAEAALAESAGESIRLDKELWADAAVVQARYRQEDPWAEILDHAIGDLEGKITSEDLLKIIGKPQGMRGQNDNQRLGEIMRGLGFEHKQTRFGKRVKWAYVRGSSYKEICVIYDPVSRDIQVCASDSPEYLAAARSLGYLDDPQQPETRDTPF